MSQDFAAEVAAHVRAGSGRPVNASTLMEVWQGLSRSVIDRVADDWNHTTATYKAGRMEHYLSAEFLMGRALLNNLSNLGIEDDARAALAAHGPVSYTHL